MQLKIDTSLNPLFVRGRNEKGEEYFVIGGELCLGETIEVAPYDEERGLYINTKLNYESIDIFSGHMDKDGLVYFSSLEEPIQSCPGRRIFELDGLWVFPEKRIEKHVDFLYESELIHLSRFKISKHWNKTVGRVPVYSVDFLKMLEDVIRHKRPKSSWFYCEKEKDFDKGVYADLFILANLNNDELNVNLWQIIGGGSEILYAHGILNSLNTKFKHFDLAAHYVSPEQIPNLIYHKKKLDLLEKKKFLRLDGEFDVQPVFEMIKMFFPLDHLVQEFWERPERDC